eukprot:8839160-Pyramimonas_sp.AAC.1
MALTQWGGGAISGKKLAQDVEFSDFFSVRRPKNVIAGTSSGLKSAAKGVAAGLATLVAAPALGAHQEGMSGFAKGLGAGPFKLQMTVRTLAYSEKKRACFTQSPLRARLLPRSWQKFWAGPL